MTKITPVVLCGGGGTRLWPRSRLAKPKPFLSLLGEGTLFEATLSRCMDDTLFDPPIVVAGEAHCELIEAQSVFVENGRVIVEPMGKNTAAAIASAALCLPQDAVMLVCPSDHHIADCEAFLEAVEKAAALARNGWLVTFGIEPTGPETGFGYIKRGAPVQQGYKVERFVEKPDLPTAQAMLAEGGYCWNGGLFAFGAGFFLRELQAHRPELANAVSRAVTLGHEEGNRFHPDHAAFAAIQDESVDYAVMENTDSAAMVPVSMGWSDIGNWQALHEARPRDELGNCVTGDVELVDCQNVMVDSDGPRVSVIGLENVVIVIDGGEVLVTTAAGAQKVGKLKGAANQ